MKLPTFPVRTLALCFLISAGCGSATCPPGTVEQGTICRRVEETAGTSAAGDANMPGSSNLGDQSNAATGQAGQTGQVSSGAAGSTAIGVNGASANSAGASSQSAAMQAGGAQGAAGGSAEPPQGQCVGNPDAVFCDGPVMMHCDAAGMQASPEPCMDATLCQLGLKQARCATCLPGTFACKGAELQVCQGGEMKLQESCASEALCNETAGACTDMTCVANTPMCTPDGVFQRCNGEGTAYVEPQSCGIGLCDVEHERCNVCIPGSSRCSGSDSLKCNADGQGEAPTSCEAPGECYVGGCDEKTGSCTKDPKRRGEPCASGRKMCDGNGACSLECATSSQCESKGECYDATCSSAGMCGNTPKPRGRSCANGSKMCDGNGSCSLDCGSATECTPKGECYEAVCSSSGQCDNTPKDKGARCANNTKYCDGNGSCTLDCTDDFQCKPKGECSTAACSSGHCVAVPIIAARNNDGCCPKNENANTDNDCRATCGNGTREPGEDCDGADCPTTCPDNGDLCSRETKPTISMCHILCSTSRVDYCGKYTACDATTGCASGFGCGGFGVCMALNSCQTAEDCPDVPPLSKTCASAYCVAGCVAQRDCPPHTTCTDLGNGVKYCRKTN